MKTIPIEDRLRVECIHRLKPGFVFQLVLAATLWVIDSHQEKQTQLWKYLLIFNSLFIALRGIVYWAHQNDAEKLSKYFLFFMWGATITAILWGLQAADTIYYLGLYSVPGIVMNITINGLMTAVIHSLAPVPKWQKIYLTVISIPVLLVFFRSDATQFENACGIMTITFTAYLFMSARGVAKDLRTTYLTESENREQKEILQEVIDSVPGFVALADNNNNWIIQSESFNEFRNSNAINDCLEQIQKSNQPLFTKEVTWQQDGKSHAFFISAQKQKQNSKRMILVGIPAGEIVKMRAELDHQRSKAEFASRLATLGEMAAGIAHEINNPLTVILGNATQLGRVLTADHLEKTEIQKVQTRVEKIIKTAFRISKIVQGLRNFSRQGDKDPFDGVPLTQLIEDTLELCREKFYRNNINLLIAEVPKININVRAVQISQVLINILTNAFDVVKDKTEKFVKMTFQITDTHLSIFISDSGEGIPPAVAAKIFDPFFTTKELGQGTGLGLSISRGIMQEHQGELLLVENSPLTTFEVRLPLKRDP